MKYSAPYGVSDTDAHYVNGNPQSGVEGSIPPASAFEEPQRELVNFILNSDITPDENDLYQLTQAVRSQFVNVIRDTSAVVNTITCMMTPPLQAYTLGLPLRVVVAHANTGNTTINAGPGLVQIVRTDGSQLLAGDVKAGGIATMIFDGTRFQLQNFLGAVSGGTANYEIKIPYTADTSVTANTITAVFTPAITTVAAGDPILVKLANAVTGATVINVNSLATAQVVKPDQSALSSGDGVPGHIMLLIWDGTRWQFANPRYASRISGYQIYNVKGIYTFTVPDKVYTLTRVRLWGAGGGGSAGYPYGSTGPTGGGGGASGGYAELIGLDVAPGQTITVTIGAGGTGCPANTWANGGTGGSSSFGGYMSATGGAGGSTAYPAAFGVGGVAGKGIGGHINWVGQDGGTASASTPMVAASQGGEGGAPVLIGTAFKYSIRPQIQNGLVGGAGGSAAVSAAYVSDLGAAGGDGRCEIEWRL
jgi:Glycine-rich domain